MMNGTTLLAAGAAAVLTALPALAADTVKGADHPLVGRFSGSTLVGYSQESYSAKTFAISGAPDRSLQPSDLSTIEGKSTLIGYDGPEGKSSLEIIRNYQAALKGNGFAQVYACDNNEGAPKLCPEPKGLAYKVFPLGPSVVENFQCFKNSRYALFRKGAAVTVAVMASDCFYRQGISKILVSVLEAATLDTGQVKVPTVGEISAAFAAEGRIALYGVYFETGKADVKPESKPTLDAVAAALAANPKLNLVITGHTDNVGTFESNVALSKKRADAVVAALTAAPYRVAAVRLTPFGAGMAAPRAPNTDDSGRAKNRRVELTPR